jgi:prevent-host-death family protein
MIVNISEAKAKLSQLVDLVYYGEEVIIAKNNLPLVDLIPHKVKEKRVLGLLKGAFIVPESLDDENTVVDEMFYGDEK